MGEESPKTRKKKKICQKRKKKNTSTPKASSIAAAQANTRSRASAASQRNPRTNMDSGEIIRVINELKMISRGTTIV